MIVNIIGECDKRPILYCVMKIFQEFGDVLLLTSSSRLVRLSENGLTGGHYQNTMVNITQDGIDDFFEQFDYNTGDFDFIIIDNIISVDADLSIYVEGLEVSENEQYTMSLLEDYQTIRLYKDKLVEPTTLYKMEQFEAYHDMCPMTPKIINEVAKVLAPALNMPANRLVQIASKNPTAVPKGEKNGRKGATGIFKR